MGPSAQCREKTCLVSDLPAKLLGPLEGREHFGRTPAARGHEGHPPGKLELDLSLIGVGDFIAPQQPNSKVELLECIGVRGSFDGFAAEIRR